MDIQTGAFTGPLDMLLSIITERKLEITEVALSEVTEQFLSHIETLEESYPEEVADFLIIASKLLLMKSRALLPLFMPEEEEAESLEVQLRLYKQFVDASKKINALWLKSGRAYFRAEPVRPAPEFVPPTNVTQDTLHKSMIQLVDRLTPPKPLPRISIERTVSVKERIAQLRALLAAGKQLSFSHIMPRANKSELIVGFLALLELVKQRAVEIDQSQVFGDMIINPVREGRTRQPVEI